MSETDSSIAGLNRRLGSINYQFNHLPKTERRLGHIERNVKLSATLHNSRQEQSDDAGTPHTKNSTPPAPIT